MNKIIILVLALLATSAFGVSLRSMLKVHAHTDDVFWEEVDKCMMENCQEETMECDKSGFDSCVSSIDGYGKFVFLSPQLTD